MKGPPLTMTSNQSYQNNDGLATRKPVYEVCDQVRLKPACSATETCQNLEIWLVVSVASVKWPLSKIVFQDQISLNAEQKYRRMLQGEHSAILPTFIMLPIVIKIFVLSIFEWLF